MCAGLAIERREIPDQLVERYRLADRFATRGDGGQEIQFLYRAPVPLLPVWRGSRLEVVGSPGAEPGRTAMRRVGLEPTLTGT